ncbi:pyruvoyl-dependent arginine decarboxylase [Haloarcula sp. JP-L23]|uniref:pyruvoyl-dependent arginine decarboxylase n=1 Tax=Haloarcula sp. JP-L23 TaxID=2716717 RepID=UPI00140E993A|nr:pyruvoyl-dependent arginine decarboxylase subunit alpha [Haloarcula sp. JP-L23]
MDRIQIVYGTGTGETALASYDAALADANIHNYNLSYLSSMIPEETAIDVIGTAPDLGPPGNRLTVVEASTHTDTGETVAAGLGWIQSEESGGVFYEATSQESENAVETKLRNGLRTAKYLREWEFGNQRIKTVSADAAEDTHTTALIAAVYGQSESLFES